MANQGPAEDQSFLVSLHHLPCELDHRTAIAVSGDGDARIPQMEYVDSPNLSQLYAKCHHNLGDSFELSLEDGIHESPKSSSIKLCASFQSELPPRASGSFELPIAPLPPSENAHLLQGIPKNQLFQFEGESQQMEMAEMRSLIDQLKAENEAKTREWEEACKSLHKLQSDLMTKSMHVGSLAFAIEGQITEKSKWFSTLRDFTRKLKIMKLENIKLAEEAYEFKKFAEEMSSSIRSAVNQQACLDEQLMRKFIEGAEERKELYNKVLELKGNIRVFCRCRPLNAEEIVAGASVVADFELAKDGELGVKANGLGKKSFKFDAVFCPQTDQADIFKDTAPFATSILDGYNVCIFAYGQTGTGKTFTMEGTEGARGVNFRILEEMFCVTNERRKLYKYSVSVSVLEVYNEQIRDLLASGTQAASTKRLEIRQLGDGTHHVPGLIEAHVSNINEVWEVLQTGSNARAVGSTNVNEHSSRSHCIHCVMVKGENLLNGECTKSKLWLVDLAGSERVAKTEVQGERLRETQNINRSLSALGDVISALATKSPHIPFRNSKLTHLLQDSLGGDSKTLMFVQISPNERDLGETICSLNFASRVRGVDLGPAKKQLDTSEYLRYKQLVDKSKLDTKSKDMQIKKMEETVYGLELKLKEKDLKNKSIQDKVKELESQLLVERKLARQHVETKIAEQHQQQQMKHQQEEHNLSVIRSPLGNRPLGTIRNVNVALANDHTNAIQSLLEKNSYKPQVAICATNELVQYIDPTEKENNPEMLEQSFLPRRTGRASICPFPKRIPVTCSPRRNSLIPFPSTPNTTQIPLHFLPLAPIPADERDESEANCLPKQAACDSPRVSQNGARKLSSVLRRSLQKKFLRKSPVMKKGVSVGGTEKLRVSIGNRGRLLGNARRPAGLKVTMQKPSHKDKERGWNIGRPVA